MNTQSGTPTLSEQDRARLIAWFEDSAFWTRDKIMDPANALPPYGGGPACVTVLQCDPKGDWAVNDQGWVHVPMVVATLVQGEVTNAASVIVRSLLHVEDLQTQYADRTQAFIAAWLAVWNMFLSTVTDPVGQAPEGHIRGSRCLVRWELQTQKQFQAELWKELNERQRGSEKDSGARGPRYPDMTKQPKAIASDPSWERAIMDGTRTMDEYVQWLDQEKDPCGTMHHVCARGGEIARRKTQHLFKRHRRYMEGPFTTHRWREVELVAPHGWIEHANIGLSFDPNGPPPKDIVAAVFALPRARFLRRLTIGGWPQLTSRYPTAGKTMSAEERLLGRIFPGALNDFVQPDRWSEHLPPNGNLRELHLYVHPEMPSFDERERRTLQELYPKLDQLVVEDGFAQPPREGTWV